MVEWGVVWNCENRVLLVWVRPLWYSFIISNKWITLVHLQWEHTLPLSPLWKWQVCIPVNATGELGAHLWLLFVSSDLVLPDWWSSDCDRPGSTLVCEVWRINSLWVLGVWSFGPCWRAFKPTLALLDPLPLVYLYLFIFIREMVDLWGMSCWWTISLYVNTLPQMAQLLRCDRSGVASVCYPTSEPPFPHL